MLSHCDIEKDFGMDSPISLNGIDNSTQFCTFSAGESKNKYLHRPKKNSRNVPVLTINLKSLLDKDEIKVVNVNYTLVKENKNISMKENKLTASSVIRQAKIHKSLLRKPLIEKNSARVLQVTSSRVQNFSKKCPYQRHSSLKSPKN